jgi:hypothetical protein
MHWIRWGPVAIWLGPDLAGGNPVKKWKRERGFGHIYMAFFHHEQVYVSQEYHSLQILCHTHHTEMVFLLYILFNEATTLRKNAQLQWSSRYLTINIYWAFAEKYSHTILYI